MRLCWLCRQHFGKIQRLFSQKRSVFCTSLKLSDTPKPTREVSRHYKSLILNKEEPRSHVNENEHDTNFITLDNIFSKYNKKRVQEKMGNVKATPRSDSDTVKDRRAAVLVPLCYMEGKPSFLFMVRSIHMKKHRGEISFPGGMEDPGDQDLTFTALRETYEEMGLPMERVEVWGQMQPSPSKMSGSWVTPVLGYCGEIDIDRLQLNPTEVEDVFTVSIATICDPANQRQTQWRYPGTIGYTMPVFLGGKYRIWGLTAIILHQVMTVLAPGIYNFTLKHR